MIYYLYGREVYIKTAYKNNGKAVTYLDLYNIMPSKLADTLNEIYPMINMAKIKELIYNTEGLSDRQKTFYYETIKLRKIYIIDKYYVKIKK